MNLKEIEYFVKIAEEKNVTRAAEKLFITPSALNQQLLNLERDLETPLFFRARGGWTLTKAGEIYLAAAREMLKLKNDTYHKLQDVIQTKKGTLSIGIPPERGSKMFTHVYPIFHTEYPHIVIKVVEKSVKSQQQLIAKGELDLGFMTLRNIQKTEDEYIDICPEELVLILPKLHPLCKKASIGTGHYPELDISLLKDEPFALMHRESTIFEHVELIFRQAGIIPNILFETSRANTIIDMVAAGMCCGIIPDHDNLAHRDEIAFFSLPDHPTWKIMASYKKGSYLSKPARRFIELADEYWKHSLNREN